MECIYTCTSNHSFNFFFIVECSHRKFDINIDLSMENLTLLWWPPCVWSGHYIDRFSIFIESRSGANGEVTDNINVNHTATQNISESLTLNIDNLPSLNQTCTEISVKIMAVSDTMIWLPKVLTKTDRLTTDQLSEYNNK